MMNIIATKNRRTRRRILGAFLCLCGLALLGGPEGCQTLPVPRPMGKRPEKTPVIEPSHSLAYYHYLKAQQFLLADDLLGAIGQYKEAATYDPQAAILQIDW